MDIRWNDRWIDRWDHGDGVLIFYKHTHTHTHTQTHNRDDRTQPKTSSHSMINKHTHANNDDDDDDEEERCSHKITESFSTVPGSKYIVRHSVSHTMLHCYYPKHLCIYYHCIYYYTQTNNKILQKQRKHTHTHTHTQPQLAEGLSLSLSLSLTHTHTHTHQHTHKLKHTCNSFLNKKHNNKESEKLCPCRRPSMIFFLLVVQQHRP